MSDADYERALLSAEKDLSELETQAALIDKRRARLQQTIATLRGLVNSFDSEGRTLTDVIRIVVRAADSYISAAEVLRAASSMGATFAGKNPKASIVTILGRLVKEGELKREPGTIKVRFRSNV